MSSDVPEGARLLRLGPGDEELCRAASRLLGISSPIDPAIALGRPEATVLVAVEDGEVTGCAYGHELVHPDGERTMLLYSLDVDAARLGRGIGRALTEAFVADARERGCTETWVLTAAGNVAANATYVAAGGTRDAEPSVMYTWRLADGHHSG